MDDFEDVDNESINSSEDPRDDDSVEDVDYLLDEVDDTQKKGTVAEDQKDENEDSDEEDGVINEDISNVMKEKKRRNYKVYPIGTFFEQNTIVGELAENIENFSIKVPQAILNLVKNNKNDSVTIALIWYNNRHLAEIPINIIRDINGRKQVVNVKKLKFNDQLLINDIHDTTTEDFFNNFVKEDEDTYYYGQIYRGDDGYNSYDTESDDSYYIE